MKRLVLLLIVVLLLFAAMLIYGLARDRSDGGVLQQPDWMGLLDSVVRKQVVTSTDFLPAQCMVSGGFRIVPNFPCKVHIRSVDGSTLRSMKLLLASGTTVEVNLQTSGSTGMSIPLKLHSDHPESSELQIPKDGADLTLDCKEHSATLPFCQVSLAR